VEQIPMPNMSSTKSLEVLVERILIAKSKDPKADVTKLERQIDQLVYQLYNLTPEEIKIIEGQTGG
jgi:type II restriction/modification system DNA methylase subunit YeeA